MDRVDDLLPVLNDFGLLLLREILRPFGS